MSVEGEPTTQEGVWTRVENWHENPEIVALVDTVRDAQGRIVLVSENGERSFVAQIARVYRILVEGVVHYFLCLAPEDDRNPDE